MINKKDEWGNIELPGLSDEELFGKNWNRVAANLARNANPEYRARFEKMMASDEYLEKVRSATQTTEFRKLKSEQSKNLWQDPEYKARQHAAITTPEVKARQREAALRREADPEFARLKRQRIKETNSKPEAREHNSKMLKKYYAEHPEAKEKLSQRQRDIASSRTQEDYEKMHEKRKASGWSESIKQAGLRKRKSIIAGGIPFASRMDAIKHYKFDPAMIQYNMNKDPDNWYYITQEEYTKLTGKEIK